MIKNIKNVSKVVFGKSAFEQLGDILKEKRTDSFMVFLVDDVFENSALEKRLPLEKNDQLIFVNVDDEPKTGKVDSLRDQIMQISGQKPDGVIGIGGGSVMDYAKSVAVMLNHEGSSTQYQGLNLAYKPSVYHVGVPTLSGTGAEVSTTAVLTGPEKKLGIKYEGTPFDQIVLDPLLIADAPKNQRFYTGMDCYIHNVESLTGITSNVLSDAYGRQSQELCRPVFLDEKIGREEADEKLMVASYLGGLSLSYSEVGICHAFSYGLSYVLGTHHGVANCIAFNQLEEFYSEDVVEFKKMVELHGIDIPQNVTANADDADLDKMVDTTLALEHMWNHAYGHDWKQKVKRERIKELFRKM
jgi:3-deoxy-alpha-D-manno-octulosonate 8-oxidase